jgi:poly-beta-1,6-N-acetyl-D-glucosamine synthase
MLDLNIRFDAEFTRFYWLGFFVLITLVQLWYYLFYFSRIAFLKKKNVPSSTPPASILICAKNEAENLQNNLPVIMNQDYPDFEVVVINDCSWDETEHVLKDMAEKYPRLKVINIRENENHTHGKKMAVMVGIKGAKYEHLLFTDADCKPSSDKWIGLMMRNFDQNNDIILGYGAYDKRKGLLNKLIRFDAFTIALMYLSASLARQPYMGVGRNMAYKRSLFFKVKGFASHYHVESGDDDLFVNEAATSNNTVIEISKEAFTGSIPKTSFKEWIRQKRRHATTWPLYKFSTRFRLAVFGISQYLFFLSFILLLAFQVYPVYVLSIFAFRLVVQIVIFKKSLDRLGEKDLIWITPFMELLLMGFYPIVSFTKRFARKSKWKN